MRNGRGGACHIRTFAGPAQGPPSTAGAGDAAVAIVPHSRASRQSTRRVKAGRRAPHHAGARACPPRYSAAEGGRYTYAAAGTGREDCPADQGKIGFGGRERLAPSFPGALLASSCPAKAGHPVFRDIKTFNENRDISVYWITRFRAFAGDDGELCRTRIPE